MVKQGKKKALVVGDNPVIAGETNSLLQQLGFAVAEMHESDRLADHLESNDYELVVFNQVLQGMDWSQSVREVKRLAGNIPVIVLATHMTQQDLRYALRAGPYLVLDRPVDKNDMAILLPYSSGGLFIALRG